MSSKARNAKKAKTGLGLKQLLNAAYLAVGLLLVLSIFLMPGRPSRPDSYRKACFQNGCLSLEDALTPAEQERGLSGRYGLADNSGMIFVFKQPDKQCMWMKDMRFNLDMAWFDQDKKVTKLAKVISPDTFPESFCADNTKYVIEMNSGQADELGLHIGDSMQL